MSSIYPSENIPSRAYVNAKQAVNSQTAAEERELKRKKICPLFFPTLSF
jgi:hypothetical protein